MFILKLLNAHRILSKKEIKVYKKTCNCTESLFLGFFQRTCFIFLKNKFSEIFISLYAYYVFSDLNLINYFLDTEVRYTIHLESGILFTKFNLQSIKVSYIREDWRKIIIFTKFLLFTDVSPLVICLCFCALNQCPYFLFSDQKSNFCDW